MKSHFWSFTEKQCCSILLNNRRRRGLYTLIFTILLSTGWALTQFRGYNKDLGEKKSANDIVSNQFQSLALQKLVLCLMSCMEQSDVFFQFCFYVSKQV